MRRVILTVVGIALALMLAVCIPACVLQDKLIFFPGARPQQDPGVVGLAFEDVRIATVDGCELAAWWIPCDAARGAVLVCHGNAGSIENRLDIAAFAHDCGCDVLLFDYRGFGASTGNASGAGVALDADAAYDWLRARLGTAGAPITLWGESLGGAVAAELATRRAARMLVLESSFTSLAEVARAHYPLLPVRLLLRVKLDTLAALAHLDLPVLVIHGRGDEIVPFAHGERLFAAARSRKLLLPFDGGHNDRGWASSPDVLSAARQFLAGD